MEFVPQLRKIELSDNFIKSIGNEFNYVSDAIVEIGLANNKIIFERVHDAKYCIENLKKLENLKRLEIQGNNIEKEIAKFEADTLISLFFFIFFCLQFFYICTNYVYER